MDNEIRTYEVLLTREATESTSVRVEASSPEEANEMALEIAGAYGDNLDDWTLDDGNCHEPYLPDPDSTEEVEDEPVPTT